MKMSNIIMFFLIVASMMIASMVRVEPCFAGAWTMQQGKAYVKFSLNVYDSDESFDSNGDTADYDLNGNFEDRNVGLYLEYGLKDDLSLVYSGSYKFLERKDDLVKREFNGFSDMDFAVKYRLMNNNYGVTAIQGLVKIPYAYDEDEVLVPGNGQVDGEIRVMFGRSLYPVIPGYMNVEGAYRYRDEEPADEMRFLGEFGVDFLKKGFARIKAEAIIGMDNADKVKGSLNPNLSPDYDLYKMSLTLGWRITDVWGVEMETLRELAGENVSKGRTYSASVTCLY